MHTTDKAVQELDNHLLLLSNMLSLGTRVLEISSVDSVGQALEWLSERTYLYGRVTRLTLPDGKSLLALTQIDENTILKQKALSVQQLISEVVHQNSLITSHLQALCQASTERIQRLDISLRFSHLYQQKSNIPSVRAGIVVDQSL